MTIKTVRGMGAIKRGFVQLEGARFLLQLGPSVPLTGPLVSLMGPPFPLRGVLSLSNCRSESAGLIAQVRRVSLRI